MYNVSIRRFIEMTKDQSKSYAYITNNTIAKIHIHIRIINNSENYVKKSFSKNFSKRKYDHIILCLFIVNVMTANLCKCIDPTVFMNGVAIVGSLGKVASLYKRYYYYHRHTYKD